LTSKKDKPFHESFEPQEEIEDKDHPLSLGDYVISYPSMPTEAQDESSNLAFFQTLLCEQFNFSSKWDLRQAISIIENFEEE